MGFEEKTLEEAEKNMNCIFAVQLGKTTDGSYKQF